MPAFRYQFRYCLLTYAQCGDLDPFLIVNHLSTLGAECIIGRELHADSGTHLHAFVDFGRKFSRRGTDLFDVGGFHPNVSPSKGRAGEGWDYAVKDGDIVAGGLERPDGSGLPTTGSEWAIIIASESEQDFWDACARLAPRSLACNFTSLRAFANWKYQPTPERYTTPDSVSFDLRRYPQLDDWVRGNVDCDNGQRNQSLVLWGPSRMGKTLWARSLRQDHAYFGGLFSMDEDIQNAHYAVFDDFGGLKFLPSYKFWFGHQKQFYVTDKYKGKKLVYWGRPSIWCSNTDPRDELGGEDHAWLEANCIFVEVTHSLLA